MKSSMIFGAIIVTAVATIGAIGATTIVRNESARAEIKADEAPKTLPLVMAEPVKPARPGEVATLRTAAVAAKTDVGAWRKLGAASMSVEDWSGAVDAYRKSAQINPSDSAAWSALGEAYVHAIRATSSSMPAPARQAFDRALAINPQDVRARFYLALEKDFSGQHDEAISELLGLLRAVPAKSAPDLAIRAAIVTSLNRTIKLVGKAAEEVRQPPASAVPSASSIN